MYNLINKYLFQKAKQEEHMQQYTVCFFGHRKLQDMKRIDDSLPQLIEELVHTKPFVEFLIGRNGEFDEYVASLIKSVQKKADIQNSSLTLVLPYTVVDISYFELYYDDIIIPDTAQNVHHKRAITIRNQWMIQHSDLVIVNVDHPSGGAYSALRYAELLKKNLINIFVTCQLKDR